MAAPIDATTNKVNIETIMADYAKSHTLFSRLPLQIDI
jgi:hypothetical protein